MKASLSVLGALGAAVLGTAVLASTTSPQTPTGATSSQAEQVTLLGCVQNESDYRRAQDKSRGGVAGTGVGVGNEFILANASMAKQGLNPATPTADAAYELTGPNEGKVKEFVGKRVEITGTLKAAETSASGKPTGGATAGPPPSGIDVTSKDLKLRELEVTSVKAATGTCPAM
jgi:hypothetical protein